MMGSFSIGRWFGFPIRIDYSWFVVLALVVWTFSRFEFPHRLPGQPESVYWLMGVAGAVLFFLSVLLHELAHSSVARARGIPVEGITLFIFGGVAQMRMEARRPVDEFLLTVVGPLSSIALAAVFYGGAVAVDFFGWAPPLGTVASFLALLNGVLAVFNLVPAFPLDGGRIFRSVAWQITGSLEKATRWSTRLGRGFGWLLLALGLLTALQGGLLAGMWAALLGWFITNAATASWRHFAIRRVLAGVKVGQVMTRDPVWVDPGIRVEELAEAYFLRRPYSAYPVLQDGRAVGLVSLEDVERLDPEERAAARVADVMREADEVPTAAPDDSLDEVIARLEPAAEGRVLVIEEGRLAGVLTLRDIGRWVERARRLRGLGVGDRRKGFFWGRRGAASPGDRPGAGQTAGRGAGTGGADG